MRKSIIVLCLAVVMLLAFTAAALAMPAGWNMVAGETTTGTGLYYFGLDDNMYTVVDESATVPGRGYWVHPTEAVQETLPDVPLPISVDLDAGWNLVGNSASVPATAQGVTFFAYNAITGMYDVAFELAPGRGAWVRSEVATTITFVPVAVSSNGIPSQ